MATTISKLNYMLTVDASQLDKGLQLSRQEVKQMRRDMKALQTPMERYETQLAKAKPLLKLGAEGQELYNRKIRAAADALHKEQRAAREATKSYKLLKRAKQAVVGFGVGLVAGISVGAATRALREQYNEIDKLAKASSRLNIELEELTALQYAAATTSGLSNDQTLKGLEKMVRRVSEAAAGTGEAQAALKDLGLEAKALTMLRPDEMFRRIADRMQLVADKGSKLRLATKIFDDEQAGIFTLLEKGAADIDRMANGAKALGMTFSSFDAARVEAANDAMTELNTVLTAFAREFSISIAPMLKDLIVEVTALMSDMRSDSLRRGGNSPISHGEFQIAADYTTAFLRTVRQQRDNMFFGRDFEEGKSQLPIFRLFENLTDIENARQEALRKASNDQKAEMEQEAKRREIVMNRETHFITKAFRLAAEEFGVGLKASGAFIQNQSEKREFALMLANGIGMLVPKLDRSREQSAMFNWLFGGESNATQASRGFNVMDSIQSGSAEAFRMEFRRVAKEDAQLKESKRTAEASEETNNLLGELLSQFDRFGESDIS